MMVLDASFALSWAFEDEYSQLTADVLQKMNTAYEAALVPFLFPLEMANALQFGKKRGRITEEGIERFFTMMHTLDIILDDLHDLRSAEDLLKLALREQITTYDATYLDLAMRRRYPLATMDSALADAARRNDITVL